MYNQNYLDQNMEGVSAQDMEALEKMDGIKEAGAIYMAETEQKMDGVAWKR